MARTDPEPASYRPLVAIDGGDCPTRQCHSSETLTRWTYFLLGCAILLPYSALTNGTSFFLSRLADSSFYTTFSSSLSSVYTVTKLFCLSYCTITLKQSSSTRRIFGSIATSIFFIASLCLSTFIQGTPLTFFSFALFNGASLAVLSSYLCAAVYSQAAILGPLFLQSVLSGQGAIAVAVSIVQIISAIISLWGLSPQPTYLTSVGSQDYDADDVAARIFFAVSTLFLGVTLAAYGWLAKQTPYASMFSVAKQQDNVEGPDELTGLISGDRTGVTIPTEENLRIYHVLKRNWNFMFSITYVYAVTLAVFPAITVRVQSVNQDIPLLLFSGIHFLAFTTGDLLGRQACVSTGSFVWSAERILTMSLVRTLLIPLILLCNVHRPGVAPTPPIINSDILFMVILVALGYSNGFLSCLALLVASSVERNPRLEGRRQDVDTVATLGGTCMMLGLASGALASFGFDAVI